MRLADVIGHWVGRVEIVLAGVENDLRDGEDALSAGDALRARAAAHRVLTRAPESPIGLALLADACEAAHLDAELALTLEDLARRAPSRAEVWVRLSRARQATGASNDEVRDALLRALAVAEPGSRARADALVALADVDLAAGDGARADLWLERIPGSDPTLVLRRAEARLLQRDPARARALLASMSWQPTDGRAALAMGTALAELGDPNAFASLSRATVLDVPGASKALSDALARLPSNEATRARVRAVVEGKGEERLARWRAAFARAEGARDAARAALREALAGGEKDAARPLLDAALDDRDPGALSEALAALAQHQDPLVTDARRLEAGVAAERSGNAEGALDSLGTTGHPRTAAWTNNLIAQIAATAVPAGAPARWAQVLDRLDAHAHLLGDRATATAVGALAAEQSSPVVVAVVGEFNAGKSTFINALIGADVAPTGVLPTTAAPHHLRWAPDAFAKIQLAREEGPTERVVAPADLRATLAGIDPATVRRVEICLPLAFLARVEIIDTPGFNAAVEGHEAVAHSAIEEADIAVWLVDATQAMKQTERRVLEQAAHLEVPVQVLINKADRLSSGEVPRVLDGVREGLAAAGLSSWRPLCAFSSKQALAGRLGDAAALQASGWASIQALLDEAIVARSGELKELTLRRRAARVVGRLVAGYEALASDEEAAARAHDERAHQAARAAAAIEGDPEATEARVASALEDAARAWTRDLAMVFVARDPSNREQAARDPVLTRYRVDRALTLLGPVLARVLADLAHGTVAAAELAPIARAIVRTSAAGATNAEGAVEAVRVVCRASVAMLVERLFAQATASPPDARARGPLRELRAFARVL